MIVKRKIGFFSAAWNDESQRSLEGVIRYIEEVPHLGLRDFSFRGGLEIDAMAAPPPWRGKVDGILLKFGVEDDDDVEDTMRWVERGDVPVVSLVRDWEHSRLAMVAIDHSEVMCIAADYLLGKGLENFIIVDDLIGRKHRKTWGRFFLQRLEKSGFIGLEYLLAFRPSGAVEDFDLIKEEGGLIALLRDSPKPVGVFAINDKHARAVCLLCEELNLEIPGEVMVIGTGDLNISRRHSPTISSVRTGSENAGFTGARLLHRLIEGAKAPSRCLLVPPEGVVERESSCPNYERENDVRRALEFIEQHACKGANVEDIVRNLGVSRRTLENRFRESRGQSPYEEIQKIRLVRAKQLLLETDLSITRIAELTGFSEHARLATFFRKQTGVSPSHFRKRDEA